MNKTFSLLATLALAAVLLPIAFAQQGQTAQPSSDQTAQPSATQPSTDQASPSTDQVQPSTQPQTPDSTAAPAAAQNTFSGTVVKAGGKYVLKNDTMTYQLDDQVKARQFEGKTVTVSGDLDKSTSVIHVSDIMTPNQK